MKKGVRILTNILFETILYIIILYIINKISVVFEWNIYLAINELTLGIAILLGVPGIIFMILLQIIS